MPFELLHFLQHLIIHEYFQFGKSQIQQVIFSTTEHSSVTEYILFS